MALPAWVIPTAISVMGSLGVFGTGEQPVDVHPEARGVLDMLRKRAKYGIDPKVLAQMRQRYGRALGEQFEGISTAAQQRLQRQQAPIAKQREVMSDIERRRFGALAGTLADVDIASERAKSDAMSQLAGLSDMFQMAPTGEGFGTLFGAGLSGLLDFFGGQGGGQGLTPEEQYMLKRWKEKYRLGQEFKL